MKALLTNYRQSPRKVRLVASLVRGKSVPKALVALSFTDKRATAPIAKLIRSAAANALANNKTSADSLFIKEIRVDKGVTMKRWMPKAMGRATPINKRTSNVVVVLGEKPVEKRKTKKKVATTKKKEENNA